MTDRLKKIQSMAQRYNELGVVQNSTVAEINAAIEARNIPPVRAMSGIEIKAVRLRWHMSQAALALTTGMSVESISKWERNESKPNKAALRILNVIADKGPGIFIL